MYIFQLVQIFIQLVFIFFIYFFVSFHQKFWNFKYILDAMHSLCSVGAKLRVCTVNIAKQYVSYFPAPGRYTVNWRDTDFLTPKS